MMYHVLLADDNRLVRQSLRASIAWEEIGCQVVAEADNGPDALEQIRRQKPDIAILDIKMPGLSGIDVVKSINEARQRILCIIITAYDDFAFAQQGLKLGVFDYLLKPVDNRELTEVLGRARCRLQQEESETREQQKLQRSGRELKRKLLGDGIYGLSGSSRELQGLLKADWSFHGYAMLLICPAGGADSLGTDGQPDGFIADQRQALQECEADTDTKLLDIWRAEGVVVLICFRSVLLARDYDKLAIRIAECIHQKNREDKRDICVSVSSLSKDLEELPDRFRQCLVGYNSRFFLENRDVIHYSGVKNSGIHNEYLLMQKLKLLYATLRERPDDVPGCLEELLSLLREGEPCDVDYVKSILIQTGIMLTCIISERRQPDDRLKSVEAIIEELTGARSLQEAYQWLRDYADTLVGLCREESGGELSGQTQRALDYLNTRYMEHVNLQDVAEHVGVSSSHLCRILKQDTGETFVSLLNKIRIRTAIRLLKEGTLKVYEIAEAVGFRNYAYFYQMFKKETGYPPKNYH